MWDRLTEIFAERSRWIAVVCLCSIAIPAYWLETAASTIRSRCGPGQGASAHQTYRQFLEKYGNEEFVVIAGEAQDPLSPDTLALPGRLASRLRQIEQVDGRSGYHAGGRRFRDSTGRTTGKTFWRNNGFFRNLLLGRDGHAFGVIAWLRRIDNPSERKVVVEQIKAAVAEVAGGDDADASGRNPAAECGPRPRLPGGVPADSARRPGRLPDDSGRRSQASGGVIAVMCAVGVTTLWTIGLMVLAGRTFNMVTVTLPSLLTVLSLSAGIHIVLRIQSLLTDSGDREIAVRRTIREVLPAVFLSNVTTAIGFGSLMLSDMQPVVDFGLFAALGMMLSFVFNAAIVPGILCWLRAGTHRGSLEADTLDRTLGPGRRLSKDLVPGLGHRGVGRLLAAHDGASRGVQRAASSSRPIPGSAGTMNSSPSG